MRPAPWTIVLGLLGPLATSGAVGAPPPRYGGAAALVALGLAPTIDPLDGDRPEDWTAGLAVYERLYGPGPTPQLAEQLPETEGKRVRIRIRTGVRRHDGRRLHAEDVLDWLDGLARPGSPSGHLLLLVEGGRDRLLGRPGLLGARAVDARTLELDLVHPYPHLARLLARPELAIVLPTEARGSAGTGPFAQVPDGHLLPFLGHRDGRPFLDRLELSAAPSRLGLEARIRGADGAVAFGGPGTICPGADVHLVLAFGPDSGVPVLSALAHRAIDRERLARRFLPEGSRAAASFFDGDFAPPPLGSNPPLDRIRLVAAPTVLPGGLPLVKRVQLELLRAGLETTVDVRDPRGTRRLRATGRFPALLEALVVAASEDPVERFHALLALAGRFGRPEAVPAGRLESFALAPPEQRGTLVDRFEAELRQALGLVVLARIPVRIRLPPGLDGVRIGPDCAVELDDARWSPR